MSIPYRTRRVLNRIGIVALVLLLILIVVWLCCTIWLQRYVVYTDGGAKLDFKLSANEVSGEIAQEPVAEHNISIYYNEGADAINTSNDLTQISGYYITSDMFQDNMDNLLVQLERLESGTAIMIDMKGSQGTFYYPSNLAGATISASTDTAAVSSLVQKLQSKGFYTIARISALQDYYFGLNNVPSGLMHISKKGLWPDGSTYWLDPTSTGTTNWISSVVLELKGMGFDEVVLDKFYFPNSDQYIFTGDKDAALQAAAVTLLESCGSSDFVLSFCTNSATFELPGERCRLYVSGVNAAGIAETVSSVSLEEPELHLVFLSDSGDTRYDDYGVLRTLYIAEEVEARKAG